MPERSNATSTYTHFRAGYTRPFPYSCSSCNASAFGNTGAYCHKSSYTYAAAHCHGNSAAYAYSTADT